jgi:hypothetical protein
MRDAEPGTDHCPAIYDGPHQPLSFLYTPGNRICTSYGDVWDRSHAMDAILLTREPFFNEFSQRIHRLSEYNHWWPPTLETNACDPY